jgi:hypothetical protein
MITLYARQEPSALTPGRRDTVFYKDRACTDRKARWAWHVSGRPVRRSSVTLNCARYRLEWLEPKGV